MDSLDKHIERVIAAARFDGSFREEHRQALREWVIAEFDRSRESSRAGAPLPFLRSWGDWVMSRPVSRLGIPAAVTVAIVAAAVVLWPARTGVALEDYIEPLMTAKTARCRVVVHTKGGPTITFKSMFRGSINRQESEEMGTVNIQDSATGTSLTLEPKTKKAMLLKVVNVEPTRAGAGGFLASIREQLLQLPDGKQVRRESLGEKRLADRTLVGFRIISPAMTMDLWGDPKTGLPHTIESSMAAFPSATVTMTDFEFDVEIDDALLSLVPPAGYTVKSETFDLRRTEEDLIAALRQYAEFNGGVFPDAVDLEQGFKIVKKMRESLPKGDPEEQQKEASRVANLMTRGFSFPLTLGVDSEATYAGKGVRRDEPEKPIFWYRPEGSQKFRVIMADLSVIEAESAPHVEGAQRIGPPPAK